MSKHGTVTTPTDLEIGMRIRLARRQRGLSQSTLGNAVGITFQQMQKYEKGANRVSVTRLLKIAEQLGMPLAHFVEGLGSKRARDQNATHELTPAQLLQTNDALRLITAFNSIKSATVRRRCIELVQSLARERDAD
ncbi:MAG TPA: helix-turn-helix transcriptional regulator [Rhizomicrobium sp.]|nr:helix-turn-helix transcriptional regulator [Rhizomicrobium sp.]